MSLRRFLSVLFVAAVALCAPSLLCAQSSGAAPKVEVFGGYSWYHPGGTVQGHDLPDLDKGWGGQFTYNLNRWAGIVLDANGHYGDYGNAHSVTVGPQFKLRTERFSPFAEILLGGVHFSPKQHPDETDFVLIAGGGLDYRVTSRFSIRPIQVNYVATIFNQALPPGRSDVFQGVRLQAGVLMNFGLPQMEREVSATCSVEPMAVDAGVAVRVSVTPSGFMPKLTVSYSYASTSVKVVGSAGSASVDTTGLAPGTYTVSAKVWENGRGAHMRSATCQTSFTINPLPMHPPTLTVSASPASLMCGDPSTITAVGSSPDNSPLTYQCAATAGQLTGNGPKYTLDTVGVAVSTIGVNCTITDARNLTASGSTSVRCSAVQQAAQAHKFGRIDFKNVGNPAWLDNEARVELDRYADALAADPDAMGVVVGHVKAKENRAKSGSKDSPRFAAKRAINTKGYLVIEKGIDPARIRARTGSGDGPRVDLWIVPAGASFPDQGTVAIK